MDLSLILYLTKICGKDLNYGGIIRVSFIKPNLPLSTANFSRVLRQA